MTDMSLAQVLRRAVEVLDERGWHQGWFVDDEGCKVCLYGAIGVAAGRTPLPDAQASTWEIDEPAGAADLYHAASEATREQLGEHFLEDWNDAPDRTVDEVKALLLAAAERAEGGS